MYIKEYMENEKIELPYNNNFRIKYGIKDNNIDITDICRNKCIHNKILTIPCGDHQRVAIFGDPLVYILKSIFIEFYKDKNKINKDIYTSIYQDEII